MNILLILSSVLLNCSAQLLIRKGMLVAGEMSMISMVHNIGSLITNIWLWGAVFAYGVSFILWLAVLAKTPVSIAFPFLSIGYVVVTICGYFFFDERISILQICGLIAICAGVILISRS